MPTVAIRFASLFALSTCILVVTLLPAEPPTKLIVSSMLVAITIVLQITISRDWFPSAPRKRESGE
ncbi:hypothetical protein RISK_004031 [Rhodopirellula islandica]|uniref:Transmembrane protein n=2 Tax=Rhodopirellula islandica TaxID=595434 RepID=A0A0J1EDJ6_RHOIS|nr:hypothetical protein RISK_004031 [Rhodopirellula islandica]